MKPEGFAPRFVPLGAQDLPPAGEVHVWYLDLGALARTLRGALDGHVGTDDPAPFTRGQMRFARRFYLRLLLGSYLGLPGKEVRINRSVRGKPVLDGTVHAEPLHFSMAKSEDSMLVGFATSGDVGVDLEPEHRTARSPLSLAKRYFSAAESAALSAMGPSEIDAAFLRTWACKEAVVKASGHGIANQFLRFTVETRLDHPAAVLEFDGMPTSDWSLRLLQPAAGFIGAVAAPMAGLDVRAFQLLPVSAFPDQ